LGAVLTAVVDELPALAAVELPALAAVVEELPALAAVELPVLVAVLIPPSTTPEFVVFIAVEVLAAVSFALAASV
jgi:hypothetical protein